LSALLGGPVAFAETSSDGQDEVEALLEQLGDPATIHAAAKELGALAPQSEEVFRRMVDALLACEENPSDSYGDHLAKVHPVPKDALDALFKGLLHHDGKEMRGTIARAIRALGSDAAPLLPALKEILHGEPRPGQWHVPGILKAVAGRDAVADLVLALRAADPLTRRASRDVLARMRDDSLPALIEALDTERYQAAHALAQMGETGVPALAAAAASPAPRVRRNAVLALGRQKQPSEAVVEALVAALDHGDPAMRALAAEGLLSLMAREAAPAAERALEREGDEQVRRVLRNARFALTVHARPVVREGLPEYTVVKKEVESDRDQERHFECSLLLDGLSEPIPVGLRREAERFRAGIDDDSVGLSWIDPGRLLRVSWRTESQGTLGQIKDSTLLFMKEAEGWRQLFRHTGVPDEGTLFGGDFRNFGFAYSPRAEELRFRVDHWFHTTCRADTVPLSYRVWLDNLMIPARAEYSWVLEWVCQLKDGQLAILEGTRSIDLEEQEFPIAEVAQCAQSVLGKSPSEIVDQIRELNPALRDRDWCTAVVTLDTQVPPFEPDSKVASR